MTVEAARDALAKRSWEVADGRSTHGHESIDAIRAGEPDRTLGGLDAATVVALVAGGLGLREDDPVVRAAADEVGRRSQLLPLTVVRLLHDYVRLADPALVDALELLDPGDVARAAGLGEPWAAGRVVDGPTAERLVSLAQAVARIASATGRDGMRECGPGSRAMPGMPRGATSAPRQGAGDEAGPTRPASRPAAAHHR